MQLHLSLKFAYMGIIKLIAFLQMLQLCITNEASLILKLSTVITKLAINIMTRHWLPNRKNCCENIFLLRLINCTI